MTRPLRRLLAPGFVALLGAAAFTFGLGIPSASPAQKSAPAEVNPPGDIPDSQVFIEYASPQGFRIKVPEGWARSDRPDGASFIDKLDGVVLTISAATGAPTVEDTRTNYLPDMETTEKGIKVSSVKEVRLPAGEAIRIVYTSDSAPNAVTSKQIRLENERYLYFKAGKLVTLEFYAPKGADNADQWQLMSQSFRWQ